MRVDVRTKFFLLFYANFLLLQNLGDWHQLSLVLVLCVLFWVQGDYRRAKRHALSYGVLLGLDYVLFHTQIGHSIGSHLTLLSFLTVGGRFILPCIMAGSLLLMTTPTSEMVGTLRFLRVPESFILVLAVMMRFIPTIRFESLKIKQSLALRGILPQWYDKVRHPVQYFEYRLIPLLMSASRIAQDLTLATLTKGVANIGKRTVYHRYTCSWLDYSLWGAMLIGCITGVMR